MLVAFRPQSASQSCEAPCCPYPECLCICLHLIAHSFILIHSFSCFSYWSVSYIPTFSNCHSPLCSATELVLGTPQPNTHTHTLHPTNTIHTRTALLLLVVRNHFSSMCKEVNWMTSPWMDRVWQNREVKKSSVLGDGGTGFSGFKGNPARRQERNLFFYFQQVCARKLCVCVFVCEIKAVGQFPGLTTRWRSCLKNTFEGPGTAICKLPPLDGNVSWGHRVKP